MTLLNFAKIKTPTTTDTHTKKINASLIQGKYHHYLQQVFVGQKPQD